MIRVLSIVEAETVTGPVKNLLAFCREARSLKDTAPVEMVFATYRRGRHSTMNDEFLTSAQAACAAVHVIPEKYRFDPAVLSQMTRLAAELHPHIVQTHSVKSHFLLRLSGLWRQYPWVAFHHGYTRPNRKMELYNRLDRWSLRKAVQVVTVTTAFERELLEAGVPRRRILVLHNAISPDWAGGLSSSEIQTLRLRLAPKGEKLLLSIGRLSQEKAHQDLLEALRLLSASRPDLDWRLVLVGEGPERARLETAAAQFHGRVAFTGQIGDVRPYYAAAGLFVLPSHSEGSPNVLLEAMAARLPIVATAVGGIPEIVTGDEHALLVPPRQPDALARAIERLLDSPELAARLVEAAAARIAHKYSPEARTRHLAELYARLTGVRRV